jgi:GNAT superfamily N-acetyltransferase
MSTTTTPPLQIVQGSVAAQAHARMVAAIPATQRCDYEYATPFEILHFDTDLRDAGVPIRRWILGDAKDPLATAFCFRATWNTPRHTFWGHVRVRPDAMGQGYGTTLVHAIEQWAATAGAQAVRVMAHPEPHHSTFLAKAGYTHIGTEQVYSLAIVDAQIPSRRDAADIRILTLADYMRREPDAIEQACMLHAAISLDVPMPDEPVVTLSKFRRLLGEEVDPKCFLLAVSGDMLVGESILMESENEAGVMWQHATGVLPAFRGLGIATSLKREAVRLAQTLHTRELKTWMETSNAAIVRINQEFGFTKFVGEGTTIHIYEHRIKHGVGNRY